MDGKKSTFQGVIEKASYLNSKIKAQLLKLLEVANNSQLDQIQHFIEDAATHLQEINQQNDQKESEIYATYSQKLKNSTNRSRTVLRKKIEEKSSQKENKNINQILSNLDSL